MQVVNIFSKKIFMDVGEFLTKIVKYPIPDEPTLLGHKALKDRIDFLKEELHETCVAADDRDFEGVVDGLIDLMYVAIGTLVAMGVPPIEAWDEVHRANMDKEPGAKPGRDMAYDAVKPEGWKPPDFTDILTPPGLHEDLKASVDAADPIDVSKISYDELTKMPAQKLAQLVQENPDLIKTDGITMIIDDHWKWNDLKQWEREIVMKKGEYGRALSDYNQSEVETIHILMGDECPPIIREAITIMARKAKDYGSKDASRKEYFPFGEMSYLTMIWTKVKRLINLEEKRGPAMYESKHDSIIDLINYAAFYGEFLRQRGEK